MTEKSVVTQSTLPLEVRERIDTLCDAFEAAWQQVSSTGQPPRIEDYLGHAREPLRSALLKELLWLERQIRQTRGESPRADEYYVRFPHNRDLIDLVFRDSVPLKLGRYRIKKVLGEGAFGRVYLGWDEETSRQVAIKVPRPDRFATQEMLNKFLNEAITLAHLDPCPGVVKVHEVGLDRAVTCYVVMQYIPGCSLKDWLEQHGTLSPSEAVQLLAQVSEAAHFAHQRGLVHRDLKPANILLDGRRRAYVADFGLALHEDVQRLRAGEMAGTLAYMSPEQVRGEVQWLDGRTDIWAIGVILYEALTGRRPFNAPRFDDLIDEIQRRSPRPPRSIDLNIPAALEAVCLRCLAKRIDERYTTAADVARELRRAVGLPPDERSFLRELAPAGQRPVSPMAPTLHPPVGPELPGQPTLPILPVTPGTPAAPGTPGRPAGMEVPQAARAQPSEPWTGPPLHTAPPRQPTTGQQLPGQPAHVPPPVGQPHPQAAGGRAPTPPATPPPLAVLGTFEVPEGLSPAQMAEGLGEMMRNHAAGPPDLHPPQAPAVQPALPPPYPGLAAAAAAAANWPQSGHAPTSSGPTPGGSGSSLRPLSVALLYKRHAQPDEQLVDLLDETLRGAGHEVFIDRRLQVGVDWAAEIDRRLRAADVVIVLLSPLALGSEMLAAELKAVDEAAQQRNDGKPRILPVRVAYSGPLPAELAGILDRLHYFLWTGPGDTPRLLAELAQALRVPPTPLHVRPTSGCMPIDAQSYILRPSDAALAAALGRRDTIVLIKGARQMGKTSLLARGLAQAGAGGARVVETDFQKLNREQLDSSQALFDALGCWMADQLGLDVTPDQVRHPRLGANINFERFVQQQVLARTEGPLVWGLDEVDRLFNRPCASEVFGLLRSWWNETSGKWERLTVVITYATEAHLFITDLDQSPFNVGTHIELADFGHSEVAELNQRYDSPLRGGQEINAFMALVGGQPFLCNRGLYEMREKGLTLEEFCAVALREDGPFGGHLRRLVFLLAREHELCQVVRGMLRGEQRLSTEAFYRLRAAGMVSGKSPRDARLRCGLYQAYLAEHL